MTDHAKNLADYLKTDVDDFIQGCADRATSLVGQLARGEAKKVPAEIMNLAIVETGAKLYQWRDAPQGVANWADYDGASTPIRVSSDALVTARKLLEPYIYPPGVFA